MTAPLVLDYIPDDGYTEHGYIAAIPRLHGAVRFEFRPIHRKVASKLRQKIRDMTEDQADVAVMTVVAEHLISWDRKDRNGNPIPISAQAIADMKELQSTRLMAIVRGHDASDFDPQWNDAQKAENEELIATAIQEGRDPGEVRDGRDLGN